MLTEIEYPALQRKLMQRCVRLVDADGHLDDGASLWLAEACHQWRLQDLLARPDEAVRAD